MCRMPAGAGAILPEAIVVSGVLRRARTVDDVRLQMTMS